jgi:hypothetical protein
MKSPVKPVIGFVGLTHVAPTIHQSSDSMKANHLQLSHSRSGRILLHLACIARHGRVHWHFRGIAREFGHRRAFR